MFTIKISCINESDDESRCVCESIKQVTRMYESDDGKKIHTWLCSQQSVEWSTFTAFNTYVIILSAVILRIFNFFYLSSLKPIKYVRCYIITFFPLSILFFSVPFLIHFLKNVKLCMKAKIFFFIFFRPQHSQKVFFSVKLKLR